MRSYRQYCAVAKALDVVGDRWNLLIVRELALRGPCRYVDLLGGLPGIATNLLADRLRDLERGGVISREDAPPPIATTLFALTERGEALKPVLVELARWGSALMFERPENDAFRAHWVAVMAEMFPLDRAPAEPPATIELRAGEESTSIVISGGGVRARPGAAEAPDLVLSGPERLILGVVAGMLDLGDARALGLRDEGDPAVLRRLRPDAPLAEAPGQPAAH